jgi:hypothetical protein
MPGRSSPHKNPESWRVQAIGPRFINRSGRALYQFCGIEVYEEHALLAHLNCLTHIRAISIDNLDPKKRARSPAGIPAKGIEIQLAQAFNLVLFSILPDPLDIIGIIRIAKVPIRRIERSKAINGRQMD